MTSRAAAHRLLRCTRTPRHLTDQLINEADIDDTSFTTPTRLIPCPTCHGTRLVHHQPLPVSSPYDTTEDCWDCDRTGQVMQGHHDRSQTA